MVQLEIDHNSKFESDMEKDGGGAAEDGDPLLDKFKPKLKLLIIPSGSNQKKALASLSRLAPPGNTHGSSSSSSSSSSSARPTEDNSYSNDDLDPAAIVATAVGPAHVGLLLKDGRVCRIGYKISGNVNLDAIAASQKQRSSSSPAPAQPARYQYGGGGGGGGGIADHSDHSSIAARILRDAEAYGLLGGEDVDDDDDDAEEIGEEHGSFAALMRQARESEAARRAERAMGGPAATRAAAGAAGQGASGRRVAAAAGGRMIYHSTLFGGGGSRVAVRRGAPVSASESVAGRAAAAAAAINVPAELIARVQDVLPNKSEAAIRRTLQRSGLNVDAAVGELLMGEDEEDDEDEDDLQGANGTAESSQDDDDSEGMPGLIDDPFSAAAAVGGGLPGAGAGAGVGAGAGGGIDWDADDSEPDALEQRYLMELGPLLAQRRAAVAAATATAPSASGGGSGGSAGGVGLGGLAGAAAAMSSLVRKRSSSSPSGKSAKPKTGAAAAAAAAGGSGKKDEEKEYAFTTTCEFAETGSGATFTAIGGMHSAMLLLADDGKLWQWKWADAANVCGIHPRAAALGLNVEGDAADPVTMLATSPYRASIATASGKIATIMDACVAIPVGHERAPADPNTCVGLLEHAASAFGGQLQADGGIRKLVVSDTLTAALSVAGRVFWWGLQPLVTRTKIAEAHERNKKVKQDNLFFSVGDKVTLRSSPLYRPGAVAFVEIDGTPCTGELLDSVWNMSDKCRFRIIKKGGVPPKEQTTEDWRVDQVWFLFEGSGSQVGTILKVDGLHAAVCFDEVEQPSDAAAPGSLSSPPSTSPTDGGGGAAAAASSTEAKAAATTAEMWEKSRLFRTDELRPAFEIEIDDAHAAAPTADKAGGERPRNGKQPADGPAAATAPTHMIGFSVPEFVQTKPAPIAASCCVLDVAAGVDSVHVLQRRRQPVAADKTGSALPGIDEYEHAVYSVLPDPTSAATPYSGHDFMIMEAPPTASNESAKQLGIHTGVLSNASRFISTADCKFMAYFCAGGSVLTNIPGAAKRTVIDVPGATAAATGSTSAKKGAKATKMHITAVVVKPACLSECVLSKDPKGLKQLLDDASKSGDKAGVLPAEVQACFESEVLDGSRNPLHVAISVLTGLQTSTASTASRGFMGSSSIYSNSGACKAVLECVTILLEAAPLAPLRVGMLSHLDEQGRTPLMAAVQSGEFEAGIALLKASLDAAAGKEDILAAVLAKDAVSGSTLMHSLVAHEMTSVDFTGPNHVCQHVFECHTCGMTQDYCLSVGCARLCHRGHDVRYKGIAPTAYCDCREQGLCKAVKPRLKSEHRRKLLLRFLEVEQLLVAENCDNETPLFTLATQLPALAVFGSGGNAPKRSEAADEIAERTEALRQLVQSWPAVQATLLTGLLTDEMSAAARSMDEDADLLQDNTVLLDHFTFRLVADGTSEILALLIHTLNKAIADDVGNVNVACRFVRSVVRVYTVMSSGKLDNAKPTEAEPQMMPGARAAAARGNGGVYIQESPAMAHCITIFSALPALAVQELAENADAIIAPVRVGLVKPHAVFGTENTQQSIQESVALQGGHFPVTDPDEVFSVFQFGKSATPSSRQSAAEAADRFAAVEALADSNGVATAGSGGGVDAAGTAVEPNATGAGHEQGAATGEASAAADASAEDASTLASMGWATRRYQIQNKNGKRRRGGDPHSAGMPRYRSVHDPTGRGESAGGVDGVAPLEQATTSMEYIGRLYSRMIKVTTDIITKSTLKGSAGMATAAVQGSTTIMPDPGGRLMRQSIVVMEQQLERTWMWLAGALDSIEAQLLSGARIAASQHVSPGGGGGAAGNSATLGGSRRAAPSASRHAHRRHRRDPPGRTSSDRPLGQLNFREYLLSLMRGHSGEHGDFLPSIDVSATKHLAYSLDAFVYYLRTQASKKVPADEKKFFVRSESIVTSGAVETSVFTTPLREALPLAERPDRLHPLSSRSTLFGESTSGMAARTPPRHLALSGRLSSPVERDVLTPLLSGPPTAGSGGGSGGKGRISSSSLLMGSTAGGGVNILPSLGEFGPDMPSERWRIITGLFVQMFVDDVGAERDSFLADLGGFRVREERFRATMHDLKSSLPDSSSSDAKLLNLERPRLKLLSGTIKQLNTQYAKRKHKQLPLCCREVKVSFKDEPGEGTGVARSFYAAVGEALLQEGPLPSPQTCSNDANRGGSSGTPKASRPAGASLGAADMVEIYTAAPEEKRPILLEWLIPLVNKRSEVKSKAEAATVADWITKAMSESSVVLMLAVAKIEDAVLNAGVQAVRDDLRTADKKRKASVGTAQSSFSGGSGATFTKSSATTAASIPSSGGGAASPTKKAKTSSSSSTSRPSTATSTKFVPPRAAPGDSLASRFASSDGEIKALLHCPGKPGFFCPVPGKWTSFLLAWFRAIGRLMGLSVAHNDIFPITFTRPVLKFILGRKVAWHDLAFFDPVLFETLRKTVVAGTSTPSTVESWDLSFVIDLPEWMGGAAVELVPDGSNVPVTSANVRSYVELYAQHLMVEAIRPALVAIRSGILDALPVSSLAGLTAEDFRLLLNGCHKIDVAMLERCCEFVDETGRSGNLMETTKAWFWEIVRGMSTEEQHDLVYFWTSSPSLPATDAGLVPKPCILVRPASDGDAGLLPTANTCISRLSLPAYPSQQILKDKLLMAIQTKTFGFV